MFELAEKQMFLCVYYENEHSLTHTEHGVIWTKLGVFDIEMQPLQTAVLFALIVGAELIRSAILLFIP